VVLCAAGDALANGGDFYVGDLGQAIAAILIFAILLFVLGKWAWGPVARQLQVREQDVADTIKNAHRREKEARDLADHYKTRMDNAESEAQEIIAGSRKQAQDAREEMIELARIEAQKSVKQAHVEIEQAKGQAIREMRGATAQMAADIAGRIIKTSLTPEMQQELVDSSIKEIGRKAAEES